MEHENLKCAVSFISYKTKDKTQIDIKQLLYFEGCYLKESNSDFRRDQKRCFQKILEAIFQYFQKDLEIHDTSSLQTCSS